MNLMTQARVSLGVGGKKADLKALNGSRGEGCDGSDLNVSFFEVEG